MCSSRVDYLAQKNKKGKKVKYQGKYGRRGNTSHSTRHQLVPFLCGTVREDFTPSSSLLKKLAMSPRSGYGQLQASFPIFLGNSVPPDLV